MQTIKINPEAKKSISWILLITLLATVVLIVLNVKYYNRYADFQTVDAIISDVTRHATKSPSSKNRTSYTNSITYECIKYDGALYQNHPGRQAERN